MSDMALWPTDLGKRAGLKAVVLAVLFILWLVILGCLLYLQFEARVRHDLVVLPSAGMLVSNFAAAALVPLLILCAFFLREQKGGWDSGLPGTFLNLLCIVLGAAIGWGLAVVLVPFDEFDGAIYSKLGAGVTAFLSGFVVSYVHPLVKEQLEERGRAFLVQIGLGASALLITGLAVTVNRTEYLESARLDRAEQLTLEAAERAAIESVKARFARDYEALRVKRREVRRADARQAVEELSSASICLFGSTICSRERSASDSTDRR